MSTIAKKLKVMKQRWEVLMMENLEWEGHLQDKIRNNNSCNKTKAFLNEMKTMKKIAKVKIKNSHKVPIIQMNMQTFQ